MGKKKKIAILGSTGSIGTQALTVIQEHENLFEVEVLTANNNSSLLINQAKKINPKAVVIANKEKYLEVKNALLPRAWPVYNTPDVSNFARSVLIYDSEQVRAQTQGPGPC